MGPVWSRSLLTGSSGMRWVKHEEVVYGLWRVITEVGFCMCVSEAQYASSLNVSRVLTRSACCPIWFCRWILKATRWSEHLGLSNACKLFLPLQLDAALKQYYRVGILRGISSCICLMNAGVSTVPFTNNAGSVWTLDTLRLSVNQKGFLFGNVNQDIWLRSLIRQTVEPWPSSGILIKRILITNPSSK